MGCAFEFRPAEWEFFAANKATQVPTEKHDMTPCTGSPTVTWRDHAHHGARDSQAPWALMLSRTTTWSTRSAVPSYEGIGPRSIRRCSCEAGRQSSSTEPAHTSLSRSFAIVLARSRCSPACWRRFEIGSACRLSRTWRREDPDGSFTKGAGAAGRRRVRVAADCCWPSHSPERRRASTTANGCVDAEANARPAPSAYPRLARPRRRETPGRRCATCRRYVAHRAARLSARAKPGRRDRGPWLQGAALQHEIFGSGPLAALRLAGGASPQAVAILPVPALNEDDRHHRHAPDGHPEIIRLVVIFCAPRRACSLVGALLVGYGTL